MEGKTVNSKKEELKKELKEWRRNHMKNKIRDIAFVSFQAAVFILGATFVISIVVIVARLAWILMIADACVK